MTEDLERLPVVDGLGRPIGIVPRADLLETRLRSDDERYPRGACGSAYGDAYLFGPT